VHLLRTAVRPLRTPTSHVVRRISRRRLEDESLVSTQRACSVQRIGSLASFTVRHATEEETAIGIVAIRQSVLIVVQSVSTVLHTYEIPSDTGTVSAGVIDRTHIAILARTEDVVVLAPQFEITYVIGAHVIVITQGVVGRVENGIAAFVALVDSAIHLTVELRRCPGNALSRHGLTCFVTIAELAITAVPRLAEALSQIARVLEGTWVPVIARTGPYFVDTVVNRVA